MQAGMELPQVLRRGGGGGGWAKEWGGRRRSLHLHHQREGRLVLPVVGSVGASRGYALLSLSASSPLAQHLTRDVRAAQEDESACIAVWARK